MKYIILVGDGMGDYPIPQLSDRTPLEAAKTPAMDQLCRAGELCRLQTVPEGFPPGSDVANLSLLGYRPQEYYQGRAPLEAASMHIRLAPEEVAFRCNLVTLAENGSGAITMVDYSAGHISTAEGGELIQALQGAADETMKLWPGISYRHLLVHNGGFANLQTVPPHDYTGQEVTDHWRRYLDIPALATMLAKARAILADHPVNARRIANGQPPANGIWLWGEGHAPSMPTLQAQYGISGALISAVDLLKGIGIYAGMEIIDVPGATGYLDTNYQGKAEAALAALRNHDLVFVHVEAPDETAHHGLLAEKIQAIEDFDGKIVQPIVNGLAEFGDYRLVLAMDHFTPLSLKTHVAAAVPIAIYDSRQARPGCGLTYSERNALTTELVLADGREFLAKVLAP